MANVLLVLLLLLFVYACYFATQRIQKSSKRTPKNVALLIDRRIPSMPLFVLPYLGAFAFWFFALYRLSFDIEAFARTAAALLFGTLLSSIFFLLFPTNMRRAELPESNKLPFRLLRFVYANDEPTNACPSLHCMLSWVCMLGLWHIYYGNILPMAGLVLLVFALCVSTLLVKQQYFLGVLTGIGIAQASFLLANNTRLLDLAVELFTSLLLLLR
ncbi:hypothetical protein LJC07_05120 [Christensenellaceae bacterium OttesenSCG-928-L17]|nr:hypothetical protein [Christensenellaceae bacterium OttesenSCG-928-L17]